jgi:hypothetical protein
MARHLAPRRRGCVVRKLRPDGRRLGLPRYPHRSEPSGHRQRTLHPRRRSRTLGQTHRPHPRRLFRNPRLLQQLGSLPRCPPFRAGRRDRRGRLLRFARRRGRFRRGCARCKLASDRARPGAEPGQVRQALCQHRGWRTGATGSPWDDSSGGKPDPAEQKRGFEAFRAAWTEPGVAHARLDGLYIWNWYGYGGPQTTSYTPRGKPAAATVRQILLDLENR